MKPKLIMVDSQTEAWLRKQNNASRSIRTLIKATIIEERKQLLLNNFIYGDRKDKNNGERCRGNANAD